VPHQLVLNYLSSRTYLAFNQTLYTLFRERETCRNDTFKLLLKALLKELFTDKGEILSCKSIKPCKNQKNSREYYAEQEINPVQIPHPSKATFKFPPPSPGTIHSQMPGGMLKVQSDRYIKLSCLWTSGAWLITVQHWRIQHVQGRLWLPCGMMLNGVERSSIRPRTKGYNFSIQHRSTLLTSTYVWLPCGMMLNGVERSSMKPRTKGYNFSIQHCSTLLTSTCVC